MFAFLISKGKKYMTIKKVINAGLFLTCLVMCLSGCGKTDRTSDTAERSVIKLGSDSYPPYNYLNEDGVPTGIDVELAQRIIDFTSGACYSLGGLSILTGRRSKSW